MASVLVHEHDEHVRGALEAQLAALGHVPLLERPGSGARSLGGIDVAVLEPVTRPGLRLARRLRNANPELALVFASVARPTDETRALAPVAHLVKPFRLRELAAALKAALPDAAATQPVALSS